MSDSPFSPRDAAGDIAPVSIDERELCYSRVLPVTARNLYRAWTEPLLLLQWFAPEPWKVIHADLNVRPGGAFSIISRGPDGRESPERGVYLEVMPRRRLVFTDSYAAAWVPSTKPFLTTVLTFEELDTNLARYTARLLHWTTLDRTTHERMGIREVWGRCTDQLAALAAKL